VLGIGFLLLVSLVLSAWLAAMGRFFRSFLPAPEPILEAATFLISFIVVTALFAAIYKLLPAVRLEWSDVIIGASVTSLMFTIGKQLGWIVSWKGRFWLDIRSRRLVSDPSGVGVLFGAAVFSRRGIYKGLHQDLWIQVENEA
jgi:cytochrome c biogenesis protein CcdA